MQGHGEVDGLRTRLMKSLEELLEERKAYKKRKEEIDKAKTKAQQGPQDDSTRDLINNLLRERVQKEHQLLLTKDQLTLACGETPTRRILQTFRDRGYMLVENEKMTSRRTIKEFNIHHMPFYVFDLGKLHVVTDTPGAASTADEAATAM